MVNIVRPLQTGAVFLFLIFLTLPLHASANSGSIRMAVIDTGFCVEKIKSSAGHQIIHPALDMTGTSNLDCSKISSKDLKESRRFHGQQVLLEFLDYSERKQALEIFPLVIYDASGTQTAAAWVKAINFVKENKIDFVLSASGFIYSDKLVPELPAVWFLPAGRLESGLNDKSVLFPQSLAPAANLLVIGDYFSGRDPFYDQSLLYQNVIDYYFASENSGNRKLNGTSRAVAHAAGLAVRYCGEFVSSAPAMRQCLNKREKILKDPVLKKEFKTF